MVIELFQLMMSVDTSIVMKELNVLQLYPLMKQTMFSKGTHFAKDNVYTDERQFSIVNVLQDGISWICK